MNHLARFTAITVTVVASGSVLAGCISTEPEPSALAGGLRTVADVETVMLTISDRIKSNLDYPTEWDTGDVWGGTQECTDWENSFGRIHSEGSGRWEVRTIPSWRLTVDGTVPPETVTRAAETAAENTGFHVKAYPGEADSTWQISGDGDLLQVYSIYNENDGTTTLGISGSTACRRA